MDIANANGKPNASKTFNPARSLNFSRERDSLTALIAELQTNSLKNQNDLQQTLSAFRTRASNDAHYMHSLAVYRRHLNNFFHTWGVTRKQESTYSWYPDHENLPLNLSLVTKKINNTWSQYFTSALTKFFLQSIGLALLIKFKKYTSQIPMTMFKYITIFELFYLFKLYCMKKNFFVKPDDDMTLSRLSQPKYF